MKKNITLFISATVSMGLIAIGGWKYLDQSRRGIELSDLTDPNADSDGTLSKCLDDKGIAYFVSHEGIISVDSADKDYAISGCS